MNSELAQLVKRNAGVISRQAALRAVSRHVLDHVVASRQLIVLLPDVYVDSGRVGDVEIRNAALLYAGELAMLSHLSALRHWSLPLPTNGGLPVHLTVPSDVRISARRSVLVVHRSLAPIPAMTRAGVAVTRLERSIVDSWPLLDGPGQRVPAITAVAERMTTPQRLLEAAQQCPNFKGRASLLALCDALAHGCRSELELWGLRHAFDDPRFAHGHRQLQLRLGTQTVYLDLAFPRERVAVELDGAAYHIGQGSRERDLRRDAALSARGWVILRFSHRRLHAAPNAVREEVADVLMTRRVQLGAA